jgi:hypothetical protein
VNAATRPSQKPAGAQIAAADLTKWEFCTKWQWLPLIGEPCIGGAGEDEGDYQGMFAKSVFGRGGCCPVRPRRLT